ncbi:MAG: hypothetical protein N4A57_07910 [Anaeromicrobium sp.]|jgi:hypothetical protein|uniref:hypothetical protein n=1 Tax=Anaeromicrobium sp. TaxID=1929132 RepID=UPI0025FB286A|nr:hypothetical protein [Anaeromicrobium sp.]MCT4594175.1 hypothetical protein [Anaeromicrobium sp.]
MSLGFIGYGRYKEEDDEYVIYEYSGENWNALFDKGDRLLYDGLIIIEKNVLKENVLGKAIEEGRVKIIKECKNAFNRAGIEFDYLALRILVQIFRDYEEKGEIPEKVAFIQ